VTLLGERIATGVAKHVRVSLQFETETTASRSLDHPAKPAVVNSAHPSLTKTNSDGEITLVQRSMTGSCAAARPCRLSGQQVGSYLRRTGREADIVAKAVRDAKARTGIIAQCLNNVDDIGAHLFDVC
jgi:hypothetical protein